MFDGRYVVLSCPEFNSLVDELLLKDMTDIEKIELESIKVEQIRKVNSFNYSNRYIDIEFKKFIEESFAEWKSDNFEKIITNKEKLKAEFLRSKTQIKSKNFYRGYINWSSYADNTPNIKMNKETVVKLKDGKVIFFAYFSFNEPNATSIISQLLFLNSLNHYGVAEINIILPYFRYKKLDNS